MTSQKTKTGELLDRKFKDPEEFIFYLAWQTKRESFLQTLKKIFIE